MQPSVRNQENLYSVQAANDVTRKGEVAKFWYRSDRFIKIDNQWYFTTRENREVGPFESRAAAEHGLGIFIECICKYESTVEHAISTATQGEWAVTFFQ